MSKGEHSSVDQSEQPVIEVGARLRRLREEKGLSQDDVVSRLNLKKPIIQALEQDDFDALPAPVFVQGYLKSYAKLLGVAEEEIISAYQSIRPQSKVDISLSTPPVKKEVHSGHGVVKGVSWFLAIGLIALVAIWWSTESDFEPIPESPVEDKAPFEPVVQQPEIIDEAPAEPEVTAKSGDSEGDEQVVSATADVPVAVPEQELEAEPESVPEPVPAAETEIAPILEPEIEAVELVAQESVEPAVEPPVVTEESGAEWQIVLEFLGPCWTNIRDANNKGRIVGNMEQGMIRVLEGPAPYSVVLGDTTMVKMTINGEAFDLQPYSRQKVAKFTLDPAAQLTE